MPCSPACSRPSRDGGYSPRKSGLAAALLAVAMAVGAPSHAAPPEQRPYSCRLLDDEQRKCAFGSCDARTVDRLRKECIRDGGRP
jgi:hypothetical protein